MPINQIHNTGGKQENRNLINVFRQAFEQRIMLFQHLIESSDLTKASLQILETCRIHNIVSDAGNLHRGVKKDCLEMLGKIGIGFR